MGQLESFDKPEPTIHTKIVKIDTNFKLPICYLEQSELFCLSDIVSNDLELDKSLTDSKSMYDYLFLPKHQFAKDMIAQWKEQYTINTEFLSDTQSMIKNMDHYVGSMSNSSYAVNCEKILSIWEDLKLQEDFLNRYGYMEWEILYQFNESASFLEILTILNVLAPLISLFIPILFIILPFVILKIQGIPISLDVYFEVLKAVAKNHFIGQALMTVSSLRWDNAIYLLFSLGFYVMQVYQNITLFQNFHKNMIKINDSLLEIRAFTKYSIQSMETFMRISQQKPMYGKFNLDIMYHSNQLKMLHEELSSISEFSYSVQKFGEMGYMLRCFYILHSNKEYEESLRYAIGFEGYINNILGIYNHYSNGHVSFSQFDSSMNCEFKDQYYPALVDQSPIRNDTDFNKNIIISSPNKSGKTTILKATTLNIIFTQQFGCGFYKSAKLNPYTHIHSYLNIPDTSGRDSLFQAESRRCKDIIDKISKYNDPLKYRHYCIFDELYSGTNPEEASKAGHAFLKYLTKFENVNFILTTHYFKICKKFLKSDTVQNYKMEVHVLSDGTLQYTYKMKKGISKIKGGISVLKDMEYPDEIIKTIESK